MKSDRQFRCTVLTATDSELHDSFVVHSTAAIRPNHLKGLLGVLIGVVLYKRCEQQVAVIGSPLPRLGGEPSSETNLEEQP